MERYVPPAGAIGLVHATSWVGQRIARKQGVPFSHAIVAIGTSGANGPQVLDVAPKTARITSLFDWGLKGQRVDWYAWNDPLTAEEVRTLRSLAHIVDTRIRYDYLALLRLALGNYSPSDARPHRMFCTHLVATVLMLLRDYDIDGNQQPWNVTPRTLSGALKNSRHFTRWYPVLPFGEDSSD